jgi:hypothetical protein
MQSSICADRDCAIWISPGKSACYQRRSGWESVRLFRKKPHIAPGAHFRASNTGIVKTARPKIHHAVTWVRENG